MATIKFFASLRQKIGRSEIELSLTNATPVGKIIKELENQIPSLSQAIAETRSIIAVNHEFGDENSLVNDQDELAFIPPMSGGSDDRVRIQSEDFSIEAEIDRVKKSSNMIGGIVTFLGMAREFSRGRTIRELEFEYYPQMAEEKLAEIREQALRDFNIIEVSIIHRYGRIDIGGNIVLIIVAAEHRADAFAACKWCIDNLKQITPIWKKEITETGDIWIEEHP